MLKEKSSRNQRAAKNKNYFLLCHPERSEGSITQGNQTNALFLCIPSAITLLTNKQKPSPNHEEGFCYKIFI
jgi:hypothetical protein